MAFDPDRTRPARPDRPDGHAARARRRVDRRAVRGRRRRRRARDGRAHAWDLGVRYFDTAPLYGYGAVGAPHGRGPCRTGRATRSCCRPRSVDWSAPATAIPPGADVDRQALDGRDDAYYAGRGPVRIVFDYSADGVRRSLEESLERLGLDRIDIALIHDPDDHWQAAIGGA